MQTTAQPATGRETVFFFRPVPPGLDQALRTLERPPTGEAPEPLVVNEFARRAVRVLAEIDRALHEDIGAGPGMTALGVSEEQNAVSGATGLVLRRLIGRSRYSAPLAELPSESGRLDPRGIAQFDATRDAAVSKGLHLGIHEKLYGEHRAHVAYALARQNETSHTYLYLARLLVTPFEIDQWRNPFLEVGSGRPI
jgi:hypothetical protein